MSDRKVHLDIDGRGAATVTLNSPSNGNAIDLDVAIALQKAMRRCEQAEGIRAVLIKGQGRIFCAGGDLVAIHRQGANAPAYVRELLSFLHQAILSIARLPVPILVAVQGAAAGAGLGLVSACDLALAAQSCRFIMAYSRVGLTPDGSSSWYLPRVVGTRRALELALLNRELSSEEALRWGLVNAIAPDAELQQHTRQWMDELTTGPTIAFGETKRLLRTSLETDLESQLATECDTICRALNGAEAAAGLAAFRDKTRPNFRA